MRRNAISVASEAWLPAFPQLTKLRKEFAHLCCSVLPIVLSTLQGGSFTSSQSSMHFTEEDKSNCFYFISLGFRGGLFWAFFVCF